MRGRKRSDLSALEGKAIGTFREAIKSQVTSDVYQRRLVLFLRWARLTADQFIAEAGKDPARVQDLITAYMLVVSPTNFARSLKKWAFYYPWVVQ